MLDEQKETSKKYGVFEKFGKTLKSTGSLSCFQANKNHIGYPSTIFRQTYVI